MNTRVAIWASGAAFLVATLVAVAGFLGIFAPKSFQKPPEPFQAYDPAPMQAAVAPDRVRATLQDILSHGSRTMGQPGFYEVEKDLRKRLADPGLEVWEHDVESLTARTEAAELLLGADRQQDVALYPFMPNMLQPMNTPADGLTGELVLLTPDILNTRTSFRGCIGLLDVSTPAPTSYGYDWTRYAQLGIAALIVTHPGGLDAISWLKLKLMVASRNPVNYVRLAASPEILKLAGQTVTLRVRTAFRPVKTSTLIARLRAGAAGKQTATEAVVIPASYDASSILCDRATCASQALPVAVQLSLLDGLKAYREQIRRDVFVVCFGSHAMAQDSQNRLLASLGQKTRVAMRASELANELARNDADLQAVASLISLFEDDAFFRDAGRTQQKLGEVSPAAATLFDLQCTYVRNTVVFELSEVKLQAGIVFEKDPSKDLNGPAFAAFSAAQRRYDKAFAAAGYNVTRALSDAKEYLAEHRIRERLKQQLADIKLYHEQQARRVGQEIALNKLFADYDNVLVLSPEVVARDLSAEAAAAPETISFSMGPDANHAGEHPVLFRNLMLGAIRHVGLDGKVNVLFTGNWHGGAIGSQTAGIPLECTLWSRFSYPAFSFVQPDRTEAYSQWFDPADRPAARNAAGLDRSLAVIGESVLSAAFGNGAMPGVKTREAIPTLNGGIYVANVGQSILPNYPKQGAVFGCRSINDIRPGYFDLLLFRTNVYGQYRYSYCATDFGMTADYTPDAVAYGKDGVISHIKDCGMGAQSIYRSIKLGGSQLSDPINLSLYRATPVTLLDTINPQTLRPFAGVDFLRSRGLTGFDSNNTFENGGVVTAFIKPDERFFVALKAGSVENELSQTIRAFMLGDVSESAGQQPGSTEIRGAGYLAQDTPLLLDAPVEIARSMIDLNGRRLGVQNRKDYRMADERTETFHSSGVEFLAQGEGGKLPKQESLLLAREAATYAELNHPVLRRNINEAVVGILWYLGLLVPFVFFFEKLVFGFADIRKQLTAITIILLIVFALLKVLHPAFAMIRSSLMVLLGFVILLISMAIAVLFSSKFQENLEEIRKRRGRVTAADVNKLGVMATAFLLGLNNMHRRRLRTWLTCATLVLMTFVMICFTSLQSDVVDTQVAIGKASFSGLVVKNERFEPIAEGEVFALRSRYGHTCAVEPRYMLIGTEDWETRKRFNPQVKVTFTPPDGPLRESALDTVMRLGASEPLAMQVKLLTHKGWFTPTQATAEEGLIPVMVSEQAARELGVTPAMVDAPDGVIVNVNDQRVLLYGIFESESLRQAHDLDGKSPLPFDVTALRELIMTSTYQILANDEDPRIAPEKIMLAPNGRWDIPIARATSIVHSVAVVIPEDRGYKLSRQQIDGYLEQTGKTVCYGLDGFAFLGRRARARTVQGLLEMLIPLIIAALTVLNTMKGSVYERKDEIFVYNSVGIAPRHVFFMFFVEAMVYAVVGSVLGYLLSQGTGRVLTWLNFTGGLNMTFASVSTIYASLAIAVSVFISTLFPARTAMKVATPTEDVGWRLPDPEGDTWTFRVPFTFGFRDRIAILAFFSRYFQDHGEGGSGKFFAGKPLLGAGELPGTAGEAELAPHLDVTVWPKPFDLGVSQNLRVALGTDPETGEYIPTITLERLTGSRENWVRLNRQFITLIRQRLLHWRAVSDDQRQQMYTEAKAQMHSDIFGSNSEQRDHHAAQA